MPGCDEIPHAHGSDNFEGNCLTSVLLKGTTSLINSKRALHLMKRTPRMKILGMEGPEGT